MQNQDPLWYHAPKVLDWVPADVDLAKISHDIETTGISAPAEYFRNLEQQITNAKAQGINLSVVYIPTVHPSLTFLRDLADYLEHQHPGTTLVMDPHIMGAASNQFPRVTLERSEKLLSLNQPDLAVGQFVHGLQVVEFPWGSVVAIVFVLSLTVAITHKYLVQGFSRLCNQAKIHIRQKFHQDS